MTIAETQPAIKGIENRPLPNCPLAIGDIAIDATVYVHQEIYRLSQLGSGLIIACDGRTPPDTIAVVASVNDPHVHIQEIDREDEENEPPRILHFGLHIADDYIKSSRPNVPPRRGKPFRMTETAFYLLD